MQLKPLLNIDETAEMADVCRSTIRNLWRDGLFPKPIRLGRRSIRWRREDVEQYIRSRKGEPHPQKEKEFA